MKRSAGMTRFTAIKVNMKRCFLVIAMFILCVQVHAQILQAVKLKCESKTDPLGIENASPSLRWQLASTQRSVMQIGYRILVTDNMTSLGKNVGNIWDSKQVLSGASIQVKYAGKPLIATKQYYWKVMLWDNKRNVSAWSKTATWQMGLLANKDWKGATWIAYEKIADSNINILPTDGKKDKYQGNNVLPMLRKSFAISKAVKKASMFISGLGHFEMSINGKKIGDHFLDPGWTKYDKQALYVPFDVTTELMKGGNAIGVMLGNGFYYVPPVSGRYRKLKSAFGYPKMICRLAIEYADGSREDVVSDQSWKTAKSPITFSSIYGGEDYDANLEQPGWDSYNFKDASWQPVVMVDGPPTLNSQMAEPLKVMQTFTPVKVTALKSNSWVYDLGQNASGITQISVQGKKGDTITIYPGELLKPDGSVSQRVTGAPYYLKYILKSSGIETWQPRFTYYGYRYLQVNGGAPKTESNGGSLPVLLSVVGLHTRNAAATSGTFSCSNELFNRTHTLIDWAIRSNMASVFTDCPHREKLGWLEQDHLMGNSVHYTYDVVNIFEKLLQDMKHSQTADGLIPEIAPEYVKFEWGGDMFRDSPEWGSSGIIIPWYLYEWYGDKTVLEESYEMMKRYASYLENKGKQSNYILKQGLGDWYDLGPKAPGVSQLTPMGVTGTAMFYYDLNILSKTAKLLGKMDDVAAYESLAMKVKQSFNDTFFNRQTNQYATGSQAANAMAVYMNLVEPEYKSAVVDNIVKDIRDHKNALTAGDIGYRYLLCVLHEAGRSDVIYDMNSRSDVPGYGYQLAKGATALTESWAALPTASNNHFMLGHLMEWFYRGLAGIDQADSSIAYKQIVIKPEIVGDVTSAKGSFESMYGTIVSDWKKEKKVLKLRANIPANTTAIIYVPAKDVSDIVEGKSSIATNQNVKFIGKDKGRIKLLVGSGDYSFSVKQD
jgi:alpha-L-rhamnosidase